MPVPASRQTQGDKHTAQIHPGSSQSARSYAFHICLCHWLLCSECQEDGPAPFVALGQQTRPHSGALRMRGAAVSSEKGHADHECGTPNASQKETRRKLRAPITGTRCHPGQVLYLSLNLSLLSRRQV